MTTCPSGITCASTIEWLNNQGLATKTVKNKTSSLQLVRNEFRELFISINTKAKNYKFSLTGAIIHKKFMHEGKATIKAPNDNLNIFICNAPTTQLVLFLKTVFIKLSSSKCSPKLSTKDKMLSLKAQTIEEISPVNVKDVGRVKDQLQINPKFQPRKRILGDNNDANKLAKKSCIKNLSTNFQLNNEQKSILEYVLKNYNIFFTGSAGTGKSYLLRHIINSLPPETTVATASTGAAACLIGGVTLHSFCGIGSGEATMEKSRELASRNIIAQNWKRCQHLIIDEISMVDGKFFEKIESIARYVRRNDKPFGGIQLIICGDFLQLPPVNKNNFCFMTSAWERCGFSTFNLKQVHRQADSAFINILNNIRIGRITKEIEEQLKNTSKQNIELGGILATRLCSHTKDADLINEKNMRELSGKEKLYESLDSPETAAKLLDDCTPVLKNIILKVGAQVMLLKNINLTKGLVNGARGIVEKFENDGPVVKFLSGEKYTVKYEKWTVKCPNGGIYIRKQIPLRFAWAFSIHKSQGLTLDCVEMCLTKTFEAGQAYVALSRAKSLQNLRVIGFDTKQVWADPDVLRFYKKLYNLEFIPLGNKSGYK